MHEYSCLTIILFLVKLDIRGANEVEIIMRWCCLFWKLKNEDFITKNIADCCYQKFISKFVKNLKEKIQRRSWHYIIIFIYKSTKTQIPELLEWLHKRSLSQEKSRDAKRGSGDRWVDSYFHTHEVVLGIFMAEVVLNISSYSQIQSIFIHDVSFCFSFVSWLLLYERMELDKIFLFRKPSKRSDRISLKAGLCGYTPSIPCDVILIWLQIFGSASYTNIHFCYYICFLMVSQSSPGFLKGHFQLRNANHSDCLLTKGKQGILRRFFSNAQASQGF